jgi:hypothetical protein
MNSLPAFMHHSGSCENRGRTSTFEYDRPSSLFGQYGNKDVTAVARELDQKIYSALINAAR